jgi:hypothetical protein
MAKVLEALIAKGRRVKRPREQKEVAFGLADLTTHEELLERIVQKGGVKSLTTLLAKSTDPEAQRFAALALANCASSQFNRAAIVQVCKRFLTDSTTALFDCGYGHFVQQGSLEPIIKQIRDPDADIIARQYCAMCVGNLAADPDFHEEIVKVSHNQLCIQFLSDI